MAELIKLSQVSFNFLPNEGKVFSAIAFWYLTTFLVGKGG
jgi:hypothetical protein